MSLSVCSVSNATGESLRQRPVRHCESASEQIHDCGRRFLAAQPGGPRFGSRRWRRWPISSIAVPFRLISRWNNGSTVLSSAQSGPGPDGCCRSSHPRSQQPCWRLSRFTEFGPVNGLDEDPHRVVSMATASDADDRLIVATTNPQRSPPVSWLGATGRFPIICFCGSRSRRQGAPPEAMGSIDFRRLVKRHHPDVGWLGWHFVG